MKKRTFVFLFLFVLVIGAFFRFYRIMDTPPGLYPDEAMNGSNAEESLSTGHFKVFYPENNGREGLFINVQAFSILLFGHTPLALRIVSAIVGTLTILAVYLVTRELFPDPKPPVGFDRIPEDDTKRFGLNRSQGIALIAAFFIATNYWHLNFSRIGFRAICTPLFVSLGLYFMLKAMRTEKIKDWVLSGLVIGLGFYTYIAFRFMPFVVAVPGIWYLVKSRKSTVDSGKKKNSISCGPCAILLFIFIIFVVALPIGLYFFHHPQEFSGRSPTDQPISVFSAPSPLSAFAKSNLQTLGMFFVRGDCNWRHNYDCQPELHPIVAIFFAAGLLWALVSLFRKTNRDQRFAISTLLGWLVFMSLPATLTKEGIPHALRSIGMIPPVMITAASGAWTIMRWLRDWFERRKGKFPQYLAQLNRIQQELNVLFILILLFIPLATYRTYFILWAENESTYSEFSTDYLHIGNYLDRLPDTTPKYVILNKGG